MNIKTALRNTVLILVVIFLAHCRSEQSKSPGDMDLASEDRTEQGDTTNLFSKYFDSASQSIPIYYNMYLTVEMGSLFENTNQSYNEDILNPVDKVMDYNTTAKKALNVGVYAVDLTYTKVFEQFDLSSAYFSAMHNLSFELGIPDDYFFNAASRFEKNLNNKDSLAHIANEVYEVTESYLKTNDLENAASLMVYGGWIEALYITLKAYDESDIDYALVAGIAEQKYSLEALLKELEKYKEDEMVKPYYNTLVSLRPSFMNLQVDPDKPKKSESQLAEIRKKISTIREGIVG